MKKVYLANVQMAFEASDDSEACDAISAMLSENLQQTGALIDWQYLPDDSGGYTAPFYVGKHPEPLEEGEIFERIKLYMAGKRFWMRPFIQLTKEQLLEQGERKFVRYYLVRAYYWAFRTMKGYESWEKTDPRNYHVASINAMDMYIDLVYNPISEMSGDLMVTASVGIFRTRNMYYVQIIIADTEHQYFYRTSPTFARTLACSDGIMIETVDVLPAGIHLNR